MKRLSLTWFILCYLLVVRGATFSEEQKLNNLVSRLLEVSTLTNSSQSFSFSRSRDGWIFISWKTKGEGTLRVVLDSSDPVISD